MNRVLLGRSGLLVAALIAFGVEPTPATAQPPPARTKWEYKMMTSTQLEEEGGGAKMAGALVAGLNKLGEAGWELVAIDPGQVSPPVRLPRYVFKRPK